MIHYGAEEIADHQVFVVTQAVTQQNGGLALLGADLEHVAPDIRRIEPAVDFVDLLVWATDGSVRTRPCL